MIKKNLATILLLALFVILPITIILMVHHVTLIETLANMDSGSMGSENTLILMESDNKDPTVLYETVRGLGSSIAVYADCKTKDDLSIRSIYFTKQYVNIPMQKGRFFKNADFVKNNYVSVIGKKLYDRTYMTDGNMYIDIDGIQFLVLGVIGYENETVWDNTVFINGLVQSSIIEKTLYTLDFFNGDSTKLTEDLLTCLGTEYNIKAKLLSSTKSFLSSFLPSVISARWFIAILFCTIVSIILISIEWIQRRKIEFCVKRMVGASAKRLVTELCFQYFFMLILSLSISIAYCTVFYPAYFNALLTGFSIFIPFFFTFLICSSTFLLRIPIREGMN